jgi:endonuclease/exonuclease/phosphatase family metal-dependent hydrolase
VRIMTLNGWGGRLIDPLLTYLRDDPPDVLCLQEVVHTPTTAQDWLTYRDGDHRLPQRANFFHDVAHTLPDHVAMFCPAAQGVLWDGDRQVPSQFGIATFVHRSLPVIAQAQGFVHKAFSPHGYGDHPRSRNAHVVRLYDYASERAVCVAHMHGLRDLRGKLDTPERRVQAERLVALVRSVAEKGDPLVVGGDFNVEPTSETFEVLAGLGLVDLVTGHGHAGTRTSYYSKPGRFADYLLVNEWVAVRRFSVVTTPEVSDHCPLILDLER